MPLGSSTEWAERLILEDLITDQEKLLEVARRLRTEYLRAMDEIARLSERAGSTREREEEAPRKRYSLSESTQQRWIRADIDFPCSQPEEGGILSSYRSHQDAVVFNAGTKQLNIQRIKNLQGNLAVYSRLPSRVPKTVYVWIENITDSKAVPVPHYRVTDKDETPEGSMYHLSIHLGRLDVSDQLRILFGRIRWLFILKANWSGTNSSSGSAGTS